VLLTSAHDLLALVSLRNDAHDLSHIIVLFYKA